MRDKKKITFHCDMTNDEIFAIMDSVHSDDENELDNSLNDSDTEYECITKDAEEHLKKESTVIQERLLEAVVYPVSTNSEEKDCDFVINKECIISHIDREESEDFVSVSPAELHVTPEVEVIVNSSCSGNSNEVESVVEDKKEVLIRKSLRGKGKKLRKTLQEVCNIITNDEASQSVSGLPEIPNPDFIRVEDLRWQEGGHETMQVSESIFPSNIQCKLSFDEDAPSPKEVFFIN